MLIIDLADRRNRKIKFFRLVYANVFDEVFLLMGSEVDYTELGHLEL